MVSLTSYLQAEARKEAQEQKRREVEQQRKELAERKAAEVGHLTYESAVI